MIQFLCDVVVLKMKAPNMVLEAVGGYYLPKDRTKPSEDWSWATALWVKCLSLERVCFVIENSGVGNPAKEQGRSLEQVCDFMCAEYYRVWGGVVFNP
jgi:hypothetical protein